MMNLVRLSIYGLWGAICFAIGMVITVKILCNKYGYIALEAIDVWISDDESSEDNTTMIETFGYVLSCIMSWPISLLLTMKMMYVEVSKICEKLKLEKEESGD